MYFLFSAPTCLFGLSAPCNKPLFNVWHPVVNARKNGMACLFSNSCIHPSSSLSLHLSIFICSSVRLFVYCSVSMTRSPWHFQYQAPGVDTQVSHTLVIHTLSVSHCFHLEWLSDKSVSWGQWLPVKVDHKRGNTSFLFYFIFLKLGRYDFEIDLVHRRLLYACCLTAQSK